MDHSKVRRFVEAAHGGGVPKPGNRTAAGTTRPRRCATVLAFGCVTLFAGLARDWVSVDLYPWESGWPGRLRFG